ncbi:flagellar hook-associated protein 3 [Clostridium tetani]|uniref:flagellar hook-associated protein FlgL n=1 Tax=Clostridium tetani TaxID=1513 RepID=UPI00100AADD5|nr:flagellar hook-associated protein FlgL [Clostridium tetani]RXM78538.1 flagellar hook-associated protein 3 [Clostridium tetani]RYU99862.1 flagellar hook-associated protein 3 [Clostridium tetani]
MRITNKMLANNFLTDMTTNLNNLQTIQQQLTSGKEIRRPSDDPIKVARAMQLHSEIGANKQYNENIKDTLSWLQQTDAALGQLGEQSQRIRELLVSAGNAAYGSDERNKINDEVKEIVGQISQTLNASFDGRYIFGGTRGTSKPVNVKDSKLVYADRDGNKIPNADGIMKEKIVTEISQGVRIEYNVTATDVIEFKDAEGKDRDLRTILEDIVKHLDSDKDADIKEITKSDLEALDAVMDNVLKFRSQVGARGNRMESALQKNKEENFNLKEILSKTEDIDLAEKTMEYAVAISVYMSALQTSARVLQPTLMDYVR